MNVDYSKSFDEQFSKLSKRQKQLATDAIELFIEYPLNGSLRDHPLKDRWINYRSITADDDLRLHYRVINKNTVLFVAVGKHDELYK